MKKYEKIIILFLIASLFLKTLDISCKNLFFLLSFFLLSISYLLAAYWLFNTSTTKEKLIPIVAGVCFFISLHPLFFQIYLNTSFLEKNIGDYILFTPLITGLFIIIFSVYLIANSNRVALSENYRNLLIRSILIFLITSFFTYPPLSFKPLNKVIYLLNNGNNRLKANLLMISYSSDFENYAANNKYDDAIWFAKKSNIEGLKWLSKSADGKDVSQNELWKIDKTFSNIYEAYTSKANYYEKQNKFNEQLKLLLLANSYLIKCDYKSKEAELQKVWSLNSIAYCNLNLKNYKSADYLYVKAIQTYLSQKDTIIDTRVARIYSNLANSYYIQQNFEKSNLLFKIAISLFKKDTAYKEELVSNYLRLANNYMIEDSLNQALFIIKKAGTFTNNQNYSETIFYDGICNYRLNNFKLSDKLFLKTLVLFKQTNNNFLSSCYLMLGYVNTELANYKQAKQYLEIGKKIAIKKFGEKSTNYAYFLGALANINDIEGNYRLSQTQYSSAIEINNNESGFVNNQELNLIAKLSNVEITLSNFITAKIHSDTCLAILKVSENKNSPSFNTVLNQIAYVNYCVGNNKSADTLYQKIIKINTKYKVEKEITTAIALNGLALLAIDNKNYLLADTLLHQSLILHQKILGNMHPSSAMVYLNLGILNTKMGRYSVAQQNFKEAQTINAHFFENTHINFANIFIAMGDLYIAKKERQIAKNYYKLAFDIYSEKFAKNHNKVILSQQKYTLC